MFGLLILDGCCIIVFIYCIMWMFCFCLGDVKGKKKDVNVN